MRLKKSFLQNNFEVHTPCYVTLELLPGVIPLFREHGRVGLRP